MMTPLDPPPPPKNSPPPPFTIYNVQLNMETLWSWETHFGGLHGSAGCFCVDVQWYVVAVLSVSVAGQTMEGFFPVKTGRNLPLLKRWLLPSCILVALTLYIPKKLEAVLLFCFTGRVFSLAFSCIPNVHLLKLGHTTSFMHGHGVNALAALDCKDVGAQGCSRAC